MGSSSRELVSTRQPAGGRRGGACGSWLALVALVACSSGGGGDDGGTPVGTCVAGRACTPAAADACRTYATTCTGGVESCGVSGNEADGTACGSGLACQAGVCSASSGTGVVGDEGGVVTARDGAKVDLPPGAVDGSLQITISPTQEAPPTGVAAVSPVYTFGPSGTIFSSPVTVTLPLPDGVSDGSVYWERLDGSGFDAIGGTVDPVARTISVETPHFSRACIGAASATRTVAGVGRITYVSPTTRTSLPGTIAAEAIVPDGSGGTTTIAAIPGTGAAEGTFRIPGVPRGEYLLHATNGDREAWLVTSTGALDLGYVELGRPPSELTPLASSAIVNLELTGLSPWQDEDLLELALFESGDGDYGGVQAAAPLAPGDTSTQLSFDVNELNYGLGHFAIEGSKGHRMFVGQLARSTSGGGLEYVAMSRAGFAPAFDLGDGGEVSVSVELTDVSQASSIAIEWRGTEWADALLDGSPSPACATGFSSCAGGVFIGAIPGHARDGLYSVFMDPLDFTDRAIDGTDEATGVMRYGSPSSLEGGWAEIAAAWRRQRVLRRLPGTTSGGVFWDDIYWYTRPETFASDPVTPPLTPVRAVSVDGADFFAGAAGMTATPTLAWSPPRVGAPAFYSIRIYRLSSAGGSTSVEWVAFVRTPHTSLTLPAGLLAPGEAYVLGVTAVAPTGARSIGRLAHAPFRQGIDLAASTVHSGIFTVGAAAALEWDAGSWNEASWQ